MANSYFFLELDTTPPVIVIHNPQFVLNGSYLEFRVSSNENLSIHQAKLVDSTFQEYPIIMAYDKEFNEYVGLVDTYGCKAGIGKIVVTGYDEVHNQTTVESAINILTSKLHDIDLAIKIRENEPSYKIRENDINYKLIQNQLEHRVRENELFSIKREHDLSVKVGDEL